MLIVLKKWIMKNKFFYRILYILYIPIKELFLLYPKYVAMSEALEAISKRDTEKKAVFYFGVPLHKNIGDLAQTYCAKRYFELYWEDYQCIQMKTYCTYSKRFLKSLKSIMQPDDIIVFQSGYCSTDRHLDHKMHKTIVGLFKDQKIIFLPQTVRYENKKEIETTSKIFNEHNRILFLARDKISYEKALDMYPNARVECFPDIVTTLIGTMKDGVAKNGILLCMRKDFEKLYSTKSIITLVNRLKNIADIVDVSDTTCEQYTNKYIYSHLKEIVYEKINQIMKYRIVITDRYHGIIFSLISNVPVIVLATTDHKVSSGIDWFLQQYDGRVYKASNLELAYCLVKKILESEKLETINDSFYMENYYKKLRDMIDQL